MSRAKGSSKTLSGPSSTVSNITRKWAIKKVNLKTKTSELTIQSDNKEYLQKIIDLERITRLKGSPIVYGIVKCK